MDNRFMELFTKVEELRRCQEEREKLQREQKELRDRAAGFYHFVVEKYHQEEQQLDDCMEKAAEENEGNKLEIVALTRRQLKAEMAGEPFADAERLENLKAEVAIYPQKLESLEQLKVEICVSATDQVQLYEYQEAGNNLVNRIQIITKQMGDLLADIRDRIVLNCLATFEYIPGRSEFMQDQFKELESMRKEEREE